MGVTEIVRFCAEEVERQGRGPIQVWNMFDAWVTAIGFKSPELVYPPRDLIKLLGHLVEPTKNNRYSWRSCGVRVGSRICPPPQEVDGLMMKWSENLPNVSPEEAYREFEEVHPFVDGNGRVGKIVFAWLRNEMESPTLPPNFFNCANR